MPNSTLELLDKSGLFRQFPQDAKQQLADISKPKQYDDGEVVYQNGDASDALYGVVSGGVKMIAEDAQGKYYMYGVSQPGVWFGEISALDGQPRAQTVVTIGKTTLLKIPRNPLIAILDANPILYKYFMSVFCKRIRHISQRLEESALLPISKRICKHLLRLNKIKQQDVAKLNQEELAASLGVTRQSVSRVLKDMEAKGWISLKYGSVEVIDTEALIDFLDYRDE